MPKKRKAPRPTPKKIAPARPTATLRPATFVRSIFPFLDLPPELRNNVYEYCVAESDSICGRDFSTLRIPTIARVSKQLRQESMGYIFENRAFDVCVGTNVWHRLWTIKSWDPIPDCGTLGLKPTVRSFLNSAAKWAVFKDITFSLFNSFDIQHVRYKRIKAGTPERDEEYEDMKDAVKWNRKEFCLALVRLTVSDGELNIDVRITNAHRRSREESWAVGAAIADLKKVVEPLAERVGFKGFTVSDVHKVAKALYWKPE